MHIHERVDLSSYTTFGIGGTADFFASATSVAELKELLAWARERSLPTTILGGGSNVLIADEGVRGLVIKNDIQGIEWRDVDDEAVRVRVGAGVVFDELVAQSVEKGLWGLENLSAIPGSVGATPIQNIGAYGVEIAEYIEAVEVFDTDAMETLTLTPAQCMFGYRDSLFKKAEGERYVVTHVVYRLSRVPHRVLTYKDLETSFAHAKEAPSLSEIRDAIRTIRKRKFPEWGNGIGTAGSFFKNPIINTEAFEILRTQYPDVPAFPVDADTVKVSLGFILDKVCDVRGYCVADVCTYEHQALVVVTHAGASAADVVAFAKEIAARVHEKTNIAIEWEVTYVS